MQRMKDVYPFQLHASVTHGSVLAEQCNNVDKQIIVSMQIANSSSIKIRNNNSLNYAQKIHYEPLIKTLLNLS